MGEQPDRRTRYSSTRYNENHTFTTTVSGHPVNYRGRSGGWEPIDNTLVSSGQNGYAYQNGANNFQAQFKSQLGDDYLRWVVDGQAVSMSLQGASRAQASAKGSTIQYLGALPHVNATYSVLGDGLEEVLELRDARAQTSFQFLLKTPEGTSVSQQADGSWIFALPGHASGSFWLKPPFAYDSGTRSLDPGEAHAQMSITQGKDGFQVTLSVDGSWLHRPSRRFPVFLDPTFAIQPDTNDATFDNNCASCTGTSGPRLAIGTTKSPVHIYRAALQFDLSAIPAGASISGANLGLLYDDTCLPPGGCSNAIQIDAHRMTAPWSAASTSSQVQFDPAVLSSVSMGAYTVGVSWLTWDVTNTVNNWIAGTQPNYGLYLMLSSEKVGQGGPEPPAMSYPDPSLTPRLNITYSGDAVVLNQPKVLHANGAELTWSQYTGPSGARFQKYEVHRSLSSGFTPSPTTLLTATNDFAATSFRDTTAAPNQTFYYAIVANSSKSNEVKVKLPSDGQATMTLRLGASAGKDTDIVYNTQTVNCANYGSDPTIEIGTNKAPSGNSVNVYRGIVSFDLHQVPSSATNIGAQLNLWIKFANNYPSTTLHAYPLTSSWDEGTGLASSPSCTGDGATWYERTGGVRWNSQGGDFDSATASSQVTVADLAPPQWESFDVSNIVTKWAGGQAPNLGFLVKSDIEDLTGGNYLYFASDNDSPAELHPTLQLTYTDGSHATAPTVSVSSPTPSSMVSGSSVTLSAAASSPGTLSQVQFFVDNNPVGTASQAPWSVTWNSASVANGSHTITAQATDNAGNSTTSAQVTVTVNNYPSPTTSIGPLPNNGSGLTGTVSVNTSNTVASGLSASKVELYLDGALCATSTASPWSFSWNTLDPTLPAYDGSHSLVSRVYDSSGLIASSSPVTVTVANTAGTLDQALFSSSAVPQAMSFDPNATSQLTYPINVTVTNSSGVTWSSATTTLRYRWYLAGSTTSFSDSANVASLGLAPGGSQTVQVNVTPPSLPAGMDAARFTLRFDMVDSSGSTPAFMADKGNLPLDNPVIVNKVLSANIGLEHFWQFTSQPVGAGITHMTNVANGNSVLSLTPLSEPGRGLSTVVDLTYNSLEEHSDSPAGNNWSLSISGLTRFGDPLDIHPNNADSIAGRSNKFINLVDGTGRLLTFTGVTGSDGVTFWEEPPGVHLWLRQVSNDTSVQGHFWAFTRPDRVTFFYDQQGFPTAVTDKNGTTISYALSAVQSGDDPGGPRFHVTQVTDAAGQGTNPAPNRSFNITYFTKATARKPQIRGKIASITDHVGHELDFAYYDDGNLLSITEQGGTNADGRFLASRSVIFTYTTSDGSGPAIPNASNRVNPDPKTPNESTKVFSVRDYNGHETTFAYNGPTTSIDRWKLASITDRAGNLTSFNYDDTNLVTTVAEPTPSGQTARTYKYAYDVQGRPTQITDPLSQATGLQWSADNALTKITEPNNSTRQFTYNDNGYPTDVIDEVADHAKLTYQNIAADSNDVSAHWNPAGGANGTGRTIPHVSQLATKQDPVQVAANSQVLWSFGYDGNGNLTSVTEPLFPNNPATNTFNSDGTLATSKDFLGNQNTYLSYDANGLPTKIADATDSPTAPTHALQIGYDSAGRTVFVQDENHASFTGGTPANYQGQFLYDSFGRLGRQTTPKSTTLSVGTLVESDTNYDPNDNVLSVVAPHCVPKGACINETANSSVGAGDTTTATYDVLDRQVQTTDPSGNKTAYAYDVAGRLTQVTLPLGVLNGIPNNTHTVNYGYDALDRMTSQAANHVNPDSSVSTLNTLACYDSVSNLVSVTAPKAGLSSITCPGTTSTPFTYVYSYDAAHRLTGATDPLTADKLNHTTSFTYDANGNRTGATDANGNTTSYTYDALNRLTQTTQPFILATSSTAAHPVVSRTVYDADGNVVQRFSPRAVDCSQVSACEPSGGTNYVTTNHYDQLNRLVRQDLPVDSTTTQYYVHRGYDFNGNLLSVSLPASQSDPTQVPPASQTVNVYFDTGWVASEQVGSQSPIHFDYNGKGQQTFRIPTKNGGLDPNSEVFWSYQPNGLLANRTDQQGQPVSYTYDADGNMLTSHDASGLTDSSQTPVDTQNAYDDLGRLVRSDLKKQTDANWTFSSFAYDLNGNIGDQDQNGQEQSPGGTLVKDGHKLHSDYDGADWLTDQIDSTLNQRVLNSFTKIGLESQREIDKSNGSGGFTPLQTTTWSYFANGKLNQLNTVNGSGTTLESDTVNYLDPNGVYVDGNRTQDVYGLRPGGTASSPCYPGTCTVSDSYDAQDRLVSQVDVRGSTTTTTSYTLDGPGNILTQATNGSVTTTNTYSGNQLQKSVNGSQTFLYWYDNLGREQCVTDANVTQPTNICHPSENATFSKDLLQDYQYDYLDRLQTYRAFSGGNRTDEANYVYDALNRLVQETEQHPSFNGDSHVTQFSYLGLSNLEVEEQQSSKSTGNTLSLKDFTYDVYGHRLAMTSTPYSNGVAGTPTTYTYGYDVHGSVSQLVDPSGNTTASYGYTPYGQSDSQLSQGDTNQTAPLNPFRYSAFRLDTGSGSLNMGARQFGPDIAHFLTPDFFYGSLSDLSLSTDPLTGNRYDMAGGNPISFKEGNGHQFVTDGGGGGTTDPSAGSQSTPTTPASSPDNRLLCAKDALYCYAASQRQAAASPEAFGLTQAQGEQACAMAFGIGVLCSGALAVDAAKHGDIQGAVLYGLGAVADLTPVPEIAEGADVAIDGGEGARAARATGRAVDVADHAPKAPVKAVKDPVGTGEPTSSESAAAGRPAATSGAPRAPEAAPVADEAERCALNSFSAGTLVLMADGSKKPIEQLKVGDKVEAGDPQKGVEKAEAVQQVIVGQGLKHLYDIHVAGGAIEATYNHPFWVVEKHAFEWAQDLKPGEHLLLADGRAPPITAVSHHDEITTVYNLSISEIHTFYVGEPATLVHNSCGTGSISPDIEALAESHITGSGDTVLGHFPGYITKANARGASYFDLGATWNTLTPDERWAANTHFLEVVSRRGDRVLLSLPKGNIRPGSILEDEVRYLTTEKGYRWVNQWALRPGA